jgi:hypothetical protein
MSARDYLNRERKRDRTDRKRRRIYIKGNWVFEGREKEKERDDKEGLGKE